MSDNLISIPNTSRNQLRTWAEIRFNTFVSTFSSAKEARYSSAAINGCPYCFCFLALVAGSKEDQTRLNRSLYFSSPTSSRNPLCPTTSCKMVACTSASSRQLGSTITTSPVSMSYQPYARRLRRASFSSSCISFTFLTIRIGVCKVSDSSSAVATFFPSVSVGFSKLFTIFVAWLNSFLTSAELYRCLESHSTIFCLSTYSSNPSSIQLTI